MMPCWREAEACAFICQALSMRAILKAALVGVLLITSTAPASAQSEEPVGLVRISFPADDGSLTPYSFELGYQLVTLIYDTVMIRDDHGTPVPWLARSVTTSGDGLQVTIVLREGIRFHDGTPLTSRDVAFTLGYVADNPHPRFTPQVADIGSIETPDSSTVVIRLSRPQAGFLDQPLADVPILPAHLWQSAGDGRPPAGLPIGSGPFRMAEHRVGRSYTFEANEKYFRGEPRVSELEVRIIRSFEKTTTALRRREIDAIGTRLFPEGVRQVDSLGLDIAQGHSYSGTVLMLNLRQEPFDDPAARRAIAAAIDLDRLAGGIGLAYPAKHGYIHPTSPWAPEAHVYAYDEKSARAAAKRLKLAPFEILAPDNDPMKLEAARQVQLAMTRAGIGARVVELTRAELGRAVGEDQGTPDFQAAIWDSPALASYDPAFIGSVFGKTSSSLPPLDHSGYSSKRFDEAARQVALAASVSQREAAVTRQALVLKKDVPVIPLYFPIAAFGFRAAIYDDWRFAPGSGIIDKLSFLPGSATPASHGEEGGGASDPEPVPEERAFGLLELSSLALVLIAVALFVLGSRRRGRAPSR
jgi:peptide/nickel transport system substrate-binding protein